MAIQVLEAGNINDGKFYEFTTVNSWAEWSEFVNDFFSNHATVEEFG